MRAMMRAMVMGSEGEGRGSVSLLKSYLALFFSDLSRPFRLSVVLH